VPIFLVQLLRLGFVNLAFLAFLIDTVVLIRQSMIAMQVAAIALTPPGWIFLSG
jgi:hypothetical protein